MRPLWQIEALRSKVSPYAFELITAQAALAHRYTAEAIDGQPDDTDIWHLKFKVVTAASEEANLKAAFEYDDSGVLQGVGGEDLGLEEVDTSFGRTCSICECSCLFAESSGLDLCRHRINRVMALIDKIPVEQHEMALGVNIATKWLVLTPDDEAAATRALRMKQVQPLSAAASSAHATSERSSHDRYALLFAEMRGLADAASQSEATTNFVLQGIRSLHLQMMDGAAVQAPWSAPEPPAAATRTSQEEHSEYSEDWKALLRLLGTEYVVDTDGDGTVTNGDWSWQWEDGRFALTFYDETVAYKWAKAGKGGWWLGQVETILTEEGGEDELITVNEPFGEAKKVNCIIKFSDRRPATCALYPDNMAQDPTKDYEKHYYVVVKKRPLADDVRAAAAAGTLRPPENNRTPGRNPAKRRRPHSGPTSR